MNIRKHLMPPPTQMIFYNIAVNLLRVLRVGFSLCGKPGVYVRTLVPVWSNFHRSWNFGILNLEYLYVDDLVLPLH